MGGKSGMPNNAINSKGEKDLWLARWDTWGDWRQHLPLSSTYPFHPLEILLSRDTAIRSTHCRDFHHRSSGSRSSVEAASKVEGRSGEAGNEKEGGFRPRPSRKNKRSQRGEQNWPFERTERCERRRKRKRHGGRTDAIQSR